MDALVLCCSALSFSAALGVALAVEIDRRACRGAVVRAGDAWEVRCERADHCSGCRRRAGLEREAALLTEQEHTEAGRDF